jgi:hypothetical protein
MSGLLRTNSCDARPSNVSDLHTPHNSRAGLTVISVILKLPSTTISLWLFDPDYLFK